MGKGKKFYETTQIPLTTSIIPSTDDFCTLLLAIVVAKCL